MSLLTYDRFVKEMTNARTGHLTNPKFIPHYNFILPKGSVIHYRPMSLNDQGLEETHPLFRGYTRTIQNLYVTEMIHPEQEPRSKTFTPDKYIRHYQQRNRRMRRLFSIQQATNPMESILVYNYCYADKGYVYMNSPKRKWFESMAWLATVFDQIKRSLQQQPQLNHFILAELPESLASFPSYVNVKNETIEQLRKFDGFDQVLILSVIQHFIPTKDQYKDYISVFLGTKHLDKVNIIITDRTGYLSVVNLGRLKSWCKSEDNPKGKTPYIFIRILYMFFLRLMNIRTEDQDGLVRLGDEVSQDDAEDWEVSEDSPEDILSDQEGDGVGESEEDVTTVTEDDLREDPSLTYNRDKEIIGFSPTVLTDREERELALLNKKLEKFKVEDQDSNVTEYQPVADKSIDSIIEASLSLQEEYGITLEKKIEDIYTKGIISPVDYKRLMLRMENTNNIIIDGKPIGEYIRRDRKQEQVGQVAIRDIPTVKDKDMLKSTLIGYDKRYVKSLLRKDLVNSILALQRGGVIVNDIKINTTEDNSGVWDTYSVDLIPIRGKPSTIRFTLPRINDEGTYKNNNSEYILRKQKTDIPIRKVTSTRVAMTSSYGKVFLDRSNKRTYDYRKWLCSSIRTMGIDKNNSKITDSRTDNVYDPKHRLPLLYSTLAQEFKTFRIDGDLYFHLDYNNRYARLGKERVQKAESGNEYFVCGHDKNKNLICMDRQNHLYRFVDGEYIPLPSIEELLGLDLRKAPIPIVDINILGNEVPVGLVLAYRWGWDGLLDRLNIPYRIIESNSKENKVSKDEYTITFRDKIYVFNRKYYAESMILNGMNKFKAQLLDFPVAYFNEKDVYFNLMDVYGGGDRYLNEIDSLYDLFVDPITLKVLEELGYPLNFEGLLLMGVKLLTTDHHQHEVSGFEQRIRGYERIPSLVYKELCRLVRHHNGKSNPNNNSININPSEIKIKFLNDPSNSPLKQLNPFQNMRQHESVTYTGLEGRAKDTMVRRTRIFHEGDIGVISESSSDSGDVGINVYTTADPNITSVYGLTKPTAHKTKEEKDYNITQLTSSIFNLSPCLDMDDSKRIGFASIHADANVPTVGYESMPLRTGYEKVIPYRVDSMFAVMASDSGKVTTIKDHYIEVLYENGETGKYPLGRIYGKDGDLVLPHHIVTGLREGQKFSVGEAICYNDLFFEYDTIDPDNLVYKYGVLTTVALLENAHTIEDGSVITQKLADRLAMKQSKIRNIVVDFNQSIHNLVQVGDQVEADSALMLLEDELISRASLFDEQSINMLQHLNSKAPKAKFVGTVEQIVVYYNGDLENMSDSLRAISRKSDAELKKHSSTKGIAGYTGKVGNNYLVDRKPLESNRAVISITITGDTVAGVGDKGVFANQLKTTFGEIMDIAPITEDGVEVDALFGARSVGARIVHSPYIMGITNRLLVEIGKKASSLYQEG